MNLRSHHLWHVAIGEPPPGALPRAHDTVRVGMALGLPAIDALVADGTGVGPLKYCLGHQSLLVPVEAAHSTGGGPPTPTACPVPGPGGGSATGTAAAAVRACG